MKKDKVDPFEAFAIDVFHDAWKKGADKAKEFEIVSFEALEEDVNENEGEPLLIAVREEAHCPFYYKKDAVCCLENCSCLTLKSKDCPLKRSDHISVRLVNLPAHS